MSGMSGSMDEKMREIIENMTEGLASVAEQIWRVSLIIGELKSPMIELVKQQRLLQQSVVSLLIQFSTAIQKGLTGFDDPEHYDPDTALVHPWTRELALREGFELLDELGTSQFAYLSARFEKAFDAYLAKDHQLAIFTFLSCLDGILNRFCEQHRNVDCQYSGSFPTFRERVDHLMNHYDLQSLAQPDQFRRRLRAFFLHRNQIMHGDEYAFFDENIATIALLFLGLTFAMATH